MGKADVRGLYVGRHRLAGTALAWFFWDVSFYGNKLFQSTFINIISGGRTTSILTNLLWTLLNSGVALIGYYFAGVYTGTPFESAFFCQSA